MLPTRFATYLHPALAAACRTDPEVAARHTAAPARAASCPAGHTLAALNVHAVNGWEVTPELVRAVRQQAPDSFRNEPAASPDLEAVRDIVVRELEYRSGIATDPGELAGYCLDRQLAPAVRALAAAVLFRSIRAAAGQPELPDALRVLRHTVCNRYQGHGDPVLRGIADHALITIARLQDETRGYRRDPPFSKRTSGLYRSVIADGAAGTRYPLEAAWRLCLRRPDPRNLRELDRVLEQTAGATDCAVADRRIEAIALCYGSYPHSLHGPPLELPHRDDGGRADPPHPLADRYLCAAIQSAGGVDHAATQAAAVSAAERFCERHGSPPPGLPDTAPRPDWLQRVRAVAARADWQARAPVGPVPGQRDAAVTHALQHTRQGLRTGRMQHIARAAEAWRTVSDDDSRAAGDAAYSLAQLAAAAANKGDDTTAGRLARNALRLLDDRHAKRNGWHELSRAGARLVQAAVSLARGRPEPVTGLIGSVDAAIATSSLLATPVFLKLHWRIARMLARQHQPIVPADVLPRFPIGWPRSAHIIRTETLMALTAGEEAPPEATRAVVTAAQAELERLQTIEGGAFTVPRKRITDAGC